MKRRRVAWLSLAVVLLGVAAAIVQGRSILFQTTEEVGARFNLRTGKSVPTAERYLRKTEPHFSWMGGGSVLVVSFDTASGIEVVHHLSRSTTAYSEEGFVIWQGDTSRLYRQPPWPYSVLTPEAVHELIREAKLFSEAAAQRGEVMLPSDWEFAQ